ncbi:MAG: DUF6544 family protein [Planctomycetota bacterium JB042]
MRIALYLLIGLGVAVLAAALTLQSMHGRDVEHVDRRFEEVLRPGDGARFDPTALEGLPAPARRWLEATLSGAGPLPASVELTFSGRMRLSPDQPWVECRTRHALARDRFVWRVSVETDEIELEGAELYADGAGEIRYWLRRFLPTKRHDADITRSLRGRLALDRVFLPSSLLPADDVAWEPIDDRRAVAVLTLDGAEERVELTVAPDGTLEHVAIRRWGHRTDDDVFTDIPFGAEILEHRTVDGIRIPSKLRVSWWDRTEREEEFFEPVLERAEGGGGGSNESKGEQREQGRGR